MICRRADLVRPWVLGAAVLVPLALGGTARASEAYYLLVFGAQQIPNQPDYSHSFATFVRAVWSDGRPPCLEAHTVSWLPRSLRVRALAPAPEWGVNLDLDATLRWACANDARVSLWGPFQITRELYLSAVARIRVLEGGGVLYKAVDFGYSPEQASNCIHAVSSVVGGQRPPVGPLPWGETASFRLLCQFGPWIIEPHRAPGGSHPWVNRALGLDTYPLIYRQPDEHPRSGVFRAPLSRLLGLEREVQASYGPP
jgi:hypothetical protein